jgi:hypothetical protein
MVNVIKKSLIENVFSYEHILVGMGINNSFSGGFAYDIGLNFPEIKERANEVSNYLDKRLLGTTLTVGIENTPLITLCYIHKGGYVKNENGEFVDYNALEKCLKCVSNGFRGGKMAAPIMGSSKYDGSGDKERILELYRKYFTYRDIDVYDYEQETFDDVMYRALVDLKRRRKEKLITNEEYAGMKNLICWRRKNGIFKQMPEGYSCKNTRFSWDDVINVSKKDLEK